MWKLIKIYQTENVTMINLPDYNSQKLTKLVVTSRLKEHQIINIQQMELCEECPQMNISNEECRWDFYSPTKDLYLVTLDKLPREIIQVNYFEWEDDHGPFQVINFPIKAKEFIFEDFDPENNYHFYVEVTVLNQTYQGHLFWMGGLPLTELHNNFHTNVVTDATMLIFNPKTKKVEVKKRDNLSVVINHLTIYKI